MVPTLKNQADSHFAQGVIHRPAQDRPAARADSARTDVIAAPALTPHAQLEKQARNLIGTAFFATLLKQMHDSPFKSELFSGGRGGEAFGGLYDQQLASRMAQRSGGKLIRPIVNKYKALADEAYRKQKQSAEQLNPEASHVSHDRRA